MGRISEPAVYSGFVINMIGQNAGKRMPMDYAVAQAMVANGNARWEDDETPVHKQLAGEIARREEERQAQEAADLQHGADARAKSVEDLLAQRARRIVIQRVTNEDGSMTDYLARPFPAVTIIDHAFLDGVGVTSGILHQYVMDEGVEGHGSKMLDVRLYNAEASYKLIEVLDNGSFVLERVGVDQFEGEIPADWHDKGHLRYIPIAKEIRRNDAPMKAIDAAAVIEEWTKSDDQIPAVAPPKAKGEGPDAGNRDKSEGAGDPAQKSVEKEKAFVQGNDDV